MDLGYVLFHIDYVIQTKFVFRENGPLKLTNDFNVRYCRQMRGEDLEGLSVEELHQMERKLEGGLHRVLSTKVG